MKKRLIFCINQLYGGGAEQQIKYITNNLSKEFNIKILVLRNKNITEVNSNIEIIKIDKLSIKNIYSFNSIFKIRRLIFKEKVISASLYFDIICGILKIFTKFDWWIRESNSAKSKIYIKNKIRSFLGIRANGIISNSKSGYNYWIKYNNNCKLIFNGYPDSLLNLNNKRHIKKENAIIASRFVSHKNIYQSIDVFIKLRELGFVEKLLIFGDGPLRYKLINYIQNCKFKKYINFKGQKSHQKILKAFRYSKALISMSDYEGTPNVAIEALSNNCQLFLSNSDSHKDFFSSKLVNFVNQNNLSFKITKKNNKDIKNFLKECRISNTIKEYKSFLEI